MPWCGNIWRGSGSTDVFHAFRRTWAWNCVKAGLPRQWIMAQAGWTTGAMLDRYIAAGGGDEAALEALRGVAPWGKG